MHIVSLALFFDEVCQFFQPPFVDIENSSAEVFYDAVCLCNGSINIIFGGVRPDDVNRFIPSHVILLVDVNGPLFLVLVCESKEGLALPIRQCAAQNKRSTYYIIFVCVNRFVFLPPPISQAFPLCSWEEMFSRIVPGFVPSWQNGR